MGSRGVLVSCIGGKEQYAAKDSIRILTEVLGLAGCALLYSSATHESCSRDNTFYSYIDRAVL